MNNHAGWTKDGKCVLCNGEDASKPCINVIEAEDMRKLIASGLNVQKELDQYQGQLLSDQLAKEEAKIIEQIKFVKDKIAEVCKSNILTECKSPTGKHEWIDEEVEGSYTLYCIHCYASHP